MNCINIRFERKKCSNQTCSFTWLLLEIFFYKCVNFKLMFHEKRDSVSISVNYDHKQTKTSQNDATHTIKRANICQKSESVWDPLISLMNSFMYCKYCSWKLLKEIKGSKCSLNFFEQYIIRQLSRSLTFSTN